MTFFMKALGYLSKNFSILSFLFYFCLTFLLVLYYTIGKKFKIQWLILLFASLFFYLINGLVTSLWIFIPVLLTFTVSYKIENIEDKRKTLVVSITVIIDVLFLIYFKEQNFFVSTHNVFAHIFHNELWSPVRKAAPLGISYLILMLISYILDVSWGTVKPQKNILKFLLYVIYFPVVTSGPITRYSEVENQLFKTHKFDYDKFCFGVQRILWGFFKKLVIAERLGHIVNTVYGNWENTQGIVLAFGMLLYVPQVYFDFSGCIDMMLGVSECLGITLPENFKQPFFSTSLSEIWRRWHMTLGFWVKDYVLYPLLKSSFIQKISAFFKAKLGKKNRYAKLIPTWIGMFVTWSVVGFWHGGTWNYIFGGGLFFFLMIAGGQLLEPLFAFAIKALHIKTESLGWSIFLRLRTFLLFSMAISFQRAQSFTTGIYMWKKVFTNINSKFFVNFLQIIDIDIIDYFILLIGISIEIIVSRNEYNNGKEMIHMRERIAEKNIFFRWIIYFCLIFSIIIFGMYGPGYNPNFVYAKF